MTLLLMAAGKGSRYGKLKQFDDLGPRGEFLMEFSIFDALSNGFNHIVVITQKDNVEFLRNYLSQRLPSHVSLDVLAQELTDLPAGSQFAGERPKPSGRPATSFQTPLWPSMQTTITDRRPMRGLPLLSGKARPLMSSGWWPTP